VFICFIFKFFFLKFPSTVYFYHLSLHDALPISAPGPATSASGRVPVGGVTGTISGTTTTAMASSARMTSETLMRKGTALLSLGRSEEHTSELQSRENLVCRLLLEKKK